MKITYKNYSTDAYSGQVDMKAIIYVDGRNVGEVEYVLYKKELTISYIITSKDWKRKGIASRLIKYIKQENPEYKYVSSFQTFDGQKFIHKDISLTEKKQIMNETFISYNEWLNEQEKTDPTYGCIMLYANIPDWESFHINGIDKRDVFKKPLDESYGLETEPHTTILYGIHENEIDAEIIMEFIKEHLNAVSSNIKEISIFSNDEYDVVKYDIPLTNQILKYRKLFENTFPNTQTFPDFHPHMTLAYVKSGEGKKYVKKLDDPFEVTFNKAIYSYHEKNENGKIELKQKEYVFPTKDNFEVNLNTI